MIKEYNFFQKNLNMYYNVIIMFAISTENLKKTKNIKYF